MDIQALFIDPQNDFIDTPGKPGSLAVAGAYQDMKRLAAFVDRVGNRINKIHVTLDSHHRYDVPHGLFWTATKQIGKVKAGGHPEPWTMITAAEIKAGDWIPFDRRAIIRSKMIDYVTALEAGGKYPLMIWPYHCLIGGQGSNIQDDLWAALGRWELSGHFVNTVTKGSNPYTEHYSAVKAEVPEQDDPTTNLNDGLITMLKEADIVLLAGEASSHCVKSTVEDIADNFGDENVKKLVLLRDCTSPVVGAVDFTPQADAFIAAMQKRGMRIEDSTTYMK